MRPTDVRPSETVRRRVGRTFAVISTVLSAVGMATLAVVWGWDGLIRTDAVYFATLGLGFGGLTWVLVGARADNGAVWAVAWAALFSSLFTAGLATAVVLGRRSFPGLTLEDLRDLSPAQLPLGAAIALYFRFWTVVPALWLPLTFGLLLFPDGQLPSPRWRFVAWWSGIAIAIATGATAWAHGPRSTLLVKSAEDTIEGTAGAVIDLMFLLSSIAAIFCAASLVVRYRNSSGSTQGQIRWIGWGGTLYIVVLIGSGSVELDVNEVLSDLLGVAAFALLIVCWGVAILKHDLYDIDTVISKSVTYVGLAAIITTLYATVVVVPLLVVGKPDGGGPGLLLPILATAVVAVLFEPLRARMQRWANHLVFGDRATPHEVLSRVTASLSEPGTGTQDLARLVAEGTGAVQAIVWLSNGQFLSSDVIWSKLPSELSSETPTTLIAQFLTHDELNEFATIRQEDVSLGAISITKPHNDPVTTADRELLADVAAGAGLLLQNIRLNQQLTERATEVRESRRRLIAAQDAERHRLERDLHDGAQQQVVALKVKLGIARTIAEREGVDEIAARISGLVADTQIAVDALRAVAHGIYPPLLESEGLETAMKAIERTSPLPLAIETVGLERYERTLEETIYFCVVETLERARMAGAKKMNLELGQRTGDLIMEINIDGQTDDIDLTAVTDRLDAAEGVVQMTPTINGTKIIASLPARRLELA